MMEEIVLTEDDLRRLEKRFGPAVRLMGAWNTDGTFGYASIPLCVVRKAADDLANPELILVLSRLEHMPERTTAFLEMLYTIGSPLITAIVAACRERSSEGMGNRRVASKPESAAKPSALVRTAAA